jgi:pimeloyl-ACP methyl ester carboxylesterase
MISGTKMNAKIDSHWILIRGLAREGRHWGEFPEQLKTEFARGGVKVRVDTIDLPGVGRFSEMRSPLSIGEITEFVRDKFLEMRRRQRESGEHPERTFLVAISLGGMVASQWMEMWPRDLNGSVLINTSFRGFSPLKHRLQPRTLRHFVEILRNQVDVVASERHVLAMVSNRPELREKKAREWAAIRESRPMTIENLARQLFAASRFGAHFVEPTVPLLLLNSLQDRMVHPACSEAIAHRWRHAQLCRHPNAGHDLPLDDADWTIQQILAWYRAL